MANREKVLVQCTIGDLYFVHERATRLAVWNLFLLCGIAGGAMISGYIIQDNGYRWAFGVCAIFFGIFMVLVILFVPETSYRRDNVVFVSAPDSGKPANSGESFSKETKLHVEHEHDHDSDEKHRNTTLSHAHTHASLEPRTSYLRTLRPFTGQYSSAPKLKIFARPFLLFFYPAVFWGFLIYGTTLTWIVVFSVVNGVIFVEPPYSFSVSQTGFISLSPFILTIIGEVISGST